MKKTIFLTVLILFILAVPVSAFASDKTTGATIYKKNCAGCHGLSGAGDGPAAATLMPKPANFVASNYKDSTGKMLKDYSEADLIDIIEYGRKGTAMPRWKRFLSSDDVADVLTYIRSL
jgi:mono/diheme cytochrome c family protein